MEKTIPIALFICIFLFSPFVSAQVIDVGIIVDPINTDDIVIPFQMRLNFPILGIHEYYNPEQEVSARTHLGLFVHAGNLFLENSASFAGGISYSVNGFSDNIVVGIGASDHILAGEDSIFIRAFVEGYTWIAKYRWFIDINPCFFKFGGDKFSSEIQLSIRTYKWFFLGMNASAGIDDGNSINIGPRFEGRIFDQHYIWVSPLFQKKGGEVGPAIAGGATFVF